MPRTDEQQICCSFCGKRESQARLIAGPDVYICSDCVQTCCDLLREDEYAADVPDHLPTPMEMKAYMVNRLAMMLLEHNEEMSMEQALSIVFNSDTYQKMMDDRTRLYYQSPMYVFAFLDQELKQGKLN